MRRHHRDGQRWFAHTAGRIAVALGTVVMLAACSEPVAPAPQPNVRVFLSGLATADVSTNSPSALGGIPVEAVDSINVELIGIAGIEPGDSVAYAWPLALTADALKPINLRSLPTQGTDSIEIARGIVERGTYTSLRVRFRSATITFNRTIISRGVTFEPGTHPLDMTHGVTYAAEVPGDSIVVRNTPVALNIVFNVASSVAGITNTDSTNLNMNPIFRR